MICPTGARRPRWRRWTSWAPPRPSCPCPHPGTGFLTDPSEAPDPARRLNALGASLAADHPGRFGYFATLPMPDVAASAAEARRALDELGADGVTLLANNQGTYLGRGGQDQSWQVLDDRSAVEPVHPADLPAPAADQYFANGLDTGVDPGTLTAVNRTYAEALFPARSAPRSRLRPSPRRPACASPPNGPGAALLQTRPTGRPVNPVPAWT